MKTQVIMKEKLNLILKDILKVEIHSEDININNTPKWDSLTHLNLVLALEEEFGIEITPEEIESLYSDYGTIVRFIETKQNQR